MNPWTPQELAILRQHYPVSTLAEVGMLLPGKSHPMIKRKIKALGVRKETPRRHLTAEMKAYIGEHFANTQSRDLAAKLNIKMCTLNHFAYKNNLSKSPELIAQIFREKMLNTNHPARAYQLKKGNVPMNKGRKQDEYMTPEAIERTKATRFKKGNVPLNHKPLGYERINVDGYIEVKVREPNVFKAKHRVLWEKHHGKIPRSHNVQFRDGNRQNIELDNLYLVSRSDQLRNENSMYARYPVEVQHAIKTMGALTRQINHQLKTK